LRQNKFPLALKMQNNDPTPTSQPDDEISLLDILVVIAENIKLLVIGPILFAAAAMASARSCQRPMRAVHG
jgi:hypothetical protein